MNIILNKQAILSELSVLLLLSVCLLLLFVVVVADTRLIKGEDLGMSAESRRAVMKKTKALQGGHPRQRYVGLRVGFVSECGARRGKKAAPAHLSTFKDLGK